VRGNSWWIEKCAISMLRASKLSSNGKCIVWVTIEVNTMPRNEVIFHG
jgi:hypothetical protein